MCLANSIPIPGRRSALPLLALALLLPALAPTAGCGGGGSAEEQPLFGNRTQDPTDVICRVGDIEITKRDLDLRYEELPDAMRSHFSGEGWERRFARFMADEALLALRAREVEVANDPLVAQQLISERRNTLIEAYKLLELFEGLEPAEEDIRAHYEANKENYLVAGAVRARHIQCETREAAEAAYAEIQDQDGTNPAFLKAVAEHSRNIATAREAGDLGWFNKGGFVRGVPYGKDLSRHIFDWEIGLHPPERIGDHWHVIEITDRRRPRQMSLNEVRERVTADLMPSLRNEAVETHLTRLRDEVRPEYFGVYAPGGGRTVEELFQYGVMANTAAKQLEVFDQLIEEFPESEFVPKALFMKANVYLDRWGDARRARSFLRQLVRDHPDSELREQAEYMLENMTKVNFSQPRSIQELQELSR